MSAQPTNYVYIPGLFDPLEVWHRDYGFTPSSEKLVKILARMTRHKETEIAWLPSLYQFLGNSESAPSRSHAQNCYLFDFKEPPPDSLMCAEPIELEAGMSDIVIGQSVINDLSAEDNIRLANLLNQHFSQDDWEFLVSDNGRWYLGLPDSHKPQQSVAIHDAIGQSLRALIDDSVDVQWSRQMNELQMLLHGSTTNMQRESQGMRLVNSFWFWDLETQSNNKFKSDAKSIIGGGYDGQVVAHHYGLDWKDLNVHSRHEESSIYIYTDLVTAISEHNLEAWQNKLVELEAFLVAMLDNEASNTIINTCNGYSWTKGSNLFSRIFTGRKNSLLDFI